jgi:hypothetical protein
MNYTLSVQAMADPQTGRLDEDDATNILADHGFNWKDVLDSLPTVSQDQWHKLALCDAEALLAWLGY